MVRVLQPLVWVALSCLATSAAQAINLPGPELDYLQRLQGAWQRHCYPSVDGDTKIYRRDFLNVDFTHMQFLSKIYLDDDCRHERMQYQARYRFSLVGAFRAAGGKKIFPINLVSSDRDAEFFAVPALNITALDQAKLYFGRDFAGESERALRLTQLDTRHPFLRH